MGKQNILFIGLILPFFLLAQKKKTVEYPIHFVENFKLYDFQNNENKYLYNIESSLWSFGVVMSDTKLYALVKIKDKNLIAEAIRGGIVLNISYSDKKKDGAQLIFPRLNLAKLERVHEVSITEKSFSAEELLQGINGYYVKGFDKIVDGLLSLDNTYGIHAVCKINDQGELLYESEVPLHLLKLQAKNMAVQLGVNTPYFQQKNARSSKEASTRKSIYGRSTTVTSAKNTFSENTDVWFTGVIK